MANKQKGEVSAKIAGTDYTLRIATNEWCELEDEFGKPTTEIVTDFFEMVSAGSLRMKMLRSFFRAAMIGTKPDITHEEAGAIMSAMGLVEAGGLLGRVIVASMPDADDAEDDAKPHPRKAAKA
ncbi:hypothetical protein [Hoeflea sp.]|uniref:hypothetical protein n=1 Tax=Hoeflea sp. TaxID=1940281 RepID=UPI002AFF3969|nr:hypothetical protein [Hoeflea sp.]